MPLLRRLTRTAVAAGTAKAVSNRVSRRQSGRFGQSSDQAQPGSGQAQPAPAEAGTDTNTKLAQLRELGQLHDSGVLDDAEFELQKSQILNS
jgi:Short C-terminal domain